MFWQEVSFCPCAKPSDKKWSTLSRIETLLVADVLPSHFETKGDKRADKVLHCLLFCNELLGEEAVYHNVWFPNFRLTTPKENRRIRPTDQIMMDSFKSLCDWLEDEADSELYSLSKIYYKIE